MPRLTTRVSKRIFVPSSDQRGRLPKLEIFRSLPPSAGTTYSPPPSVSDRNAICLPSGDQAGCQAWAAEWVIRTALPSPAGCT